MKSVKSTFSMQYFARSNAKVGSNKLTVDTYKSPITPVQVMVVLMTSYNKN